MGAEGAAAVIQLRIRRFAKQLLGWDRDLPDPGLQRGRLAPLQEAVSAIVIHNFLDIALRYDPIVRYLRARLGPDDRVLEAGSGPVGITPYLKRPVVGLDRDFTGPTSAFLHPERGDMLAMPFADRAFAAVVCVDTLEHLSAADRPAAIREIVRVCARWAVIAFPSGEPASRYDRRLDAHLRARLGRSDRYLMEHLANGLPDAEEARRLVEEAAAESGRKATVTVQGNVNVDTWLGVNRSKANLWLRAFQLTAFPLVFPILRRSNKEPCYRRILFVELA